MTSHRLPATCLIPALLVGLTVPLPALTVLQTPSPGSEGVDEMFARARGLAFSGKRPEAIALCREALQRSPRYHDIRVLIGRIHAWEGRYPEGRAELQQVLQDDPGHADARQALVDLELWADQPGAALRLCDEGLAVNPAQPALLFRKARAQKNLGAYAEALVTARLAQAADPGVHELRQFIENVSELARRSKVTLSETYDRFDKTFDPWHLTSLSLSHRFDPGSVIARINHATRFGASANQVEVDAYPRWKDGTYFYLNAGFSGETIFPHRRYGAEAYHNFPAGIEASLGFRHLRFSASSVTIRTASIGKYWGDYLFTLRGNHTPSSVGASRSGSLSVRRYFADADSYLSCSLGTGISPDQPNPNLDILNLRSRNASLGLQGWIRPRLLLSGSVAYEKQELAPGAERSQTTFVLGLEWRF